ncbi:MAG: vitamin B12-dependent ribonucleotide reductase, partial [Afipia sp.]|nr:vitamin B12-dependent ribonucleotide reductase [Afipia sp.]
HVDPSETNFDALGKGVEEGRAPDPAHSSKFISKGITRSRTDKLVVMQGGAVDTLAPSNVTALASPGATASHPSPLGGEGGARSAPGGGASALTALKAPEPERDLSPTEKLEAQQWSKAGSAAATHATPSKAERRAEAKARGYEGDMCTECSNFTLVRNGTCMKCDTCGSTTGCS